MPSRHSEVRWARKTHLCRLCQDDIKPGDQYEREVFMHYAPGGTRFSVWREHYHGYCIMEEYDKEHADEPVEIAIGIALAFRVKEVVLLRQDGSSRTEQEFVLEPVAVSMAASEENTFVDDDVEIPF